MDRPFSTSHLTGPAAPGEVPSPARSGAGLLGSALAIILLVLLPCSGCRTAGPTPPGGSERGLASWYGEPFHGRQTASGEVYDMYLMTAAHKELPFHTLVEVVNLDNGRRAVVRINDRGPFIRGRIIDVSFEAAQRLGMIGPGTARVELRILGRPDVAAGAGRAGELVEDAYTVQVGAFRDARRAEALLRELERRYPATRLSTDGVWHRVQVGEFARKRGAEKVRRELRRLGYSALIVPFR